MEAMTESEYNKIIELLALLVEAKAETKEDAIELIKQAQIKK